MSAAVVHVLLEIAKVGGGKAPGENFARVEEAGAQAEFGEEGDGGGVVDDGSWRFLGRGGGTGHFGGELCNYILIRQWRWDDAMRKDFFNGKS